MKKNENGIHVQNANTIKDKSMIEFCTSLAVFITITALIAFFIACCTGYFWNSFLLLPQ